jgi:hypothetical protein
MGQSLRALFYLGLLFSGAAWLANRYLVFEGVVAVAVGGRESLAVRPAGEGDGFTLSPTRGLSPDLLPFDNPAAARRLFPSPAASTWGWASRWNSAAPGVLERLPDLELIEARARGPGLSRRRHAGAVRGRARRSRTVLESAPGPASSPNPAAGRGRPVLALRAGCPLDPGGLPGGGAVRPF